MLTLDHYSKFFREKGKEKGPRNDECGLRQKKKDRKKEKQRYQDEGEVKTEINRERGRKRGKSEI